MIKPKITNFPTHPENPFRIELETRNITKGGTDLLKTERGYYQHIGMGENRLHDPHKFIKLYEQAIKTIPNLTEVGTKLLCFIMENMGINKTEICIPPKDFLKRYDYKENNMYAYYKAVQDLLSFDIIARKVGSTSCFFLNPNILYNGDRTKYSNYQITKEILQFNNKIIENG